MISQSETLVQAPIGTLGHYNLTRMIGRGTMTEIWLAENPQLNQQRAIKILHVQAQQSQKFVRYFEHEARAVAALTHNHILPLHDFGKQTLPDGSVITYLVLSYVAGSSLSELMAVYQSQNRIMPLQEALTLLMQAAEAIDYAHQKRIIHRDIKPSNMLISEQNQLMLADFGIARLLTRSASLTDMGYRVGTPEYLAPEQTQGHVTTTSDIYSLAVIAYQLCTGQLPFRGETSISTLMLHLTEPPPSPRQLNSALSPAFEQILMQGMAKDPQQRPALACEFVNRLQQALHNPAYQPLPVQTIKDLPSLAFQETAALSSTGAETRLAMPKLSRRQILFAGASAAAIISGAGLGTWGYTQDIVGLQRPALPAQPTISAKPSSTGTGKPVLVLTGHRAFVKQLTWSANNTTLISAGQDGQLLRWDIPHLLQQPNRLYGSPLYSGEALRYNNADAIAVWSSDGKILAVANTHVSATECQVSLYTPDLRVFSQFTFANGEVLGISWLSGKYLVCELIEGITPQDPGRLTLYVVDATHPSRRWLLETRKNDYILLENNVITPLTPNSLQRAFIHEKSLVVGEFAVSDSVIWRKRASVDLTPYISLGTFSGQVAWAGDDKNLMLLTVGPNRLVYINPLDSQPKFHALQLPEIAPHDSFYYMACNPASTSPAVVAGTSYGEIYFWNLKDQAAPIKQLDTSGFAGWVQSLAWSSDGRWLAAGMGDRSSSILVWKL